MIKKGFFSWQGNNLPWDKQGPSYIIALIIPILTVILIMFFKNKIYRRYKDNTWLLPTIGWITMAFTLLNRILLITSGYPLKWEYFPYHLCRLSVFLYAILLVVKKHNWIKYICFWSIAGSVFGLTLVDFGNLDTGDQIYYRNVGVDNYYWWDYFLAHGFGLIMPILIWTIKGWKMSYKDLWISSATLWTLSFVAFSLDWIFEDYDVNYFFLGVYSEFKLPLPDAIKSWAEWPWKMITYSILGIGLCHAFWGVWKIQNKTLAKFKIFA
ncbi:MAG: YwaF family protein [Mycoplasma sp.]|nr:YwaF family protein [Mycoplasma sp.]